MLRLYDPERARSPLQNGAPSTWEKWDALTKEVNGASFTPEQVDALAQQDQRFFKCMAALDGGK